MFFERVKNKNSMKETCRLNVSDVSSIPLSDRK